MLVAVHAPMVSLVGQCPGRMVPFIAAQMLSRKPPRCDLGHGVLQPRVDDAPARLVVLKEFPQRRRGNLHRVGRPSTTTLGEERHDIGWPDPREVDPSAAKLGQEKKPRELFAGRARRGRRAANIAQVGAERPDELVRLAQHDVRFADPTGLA